MTVPVTDNAVRTPGAPHRGARWWTAMALLFVLAVPLVAAVLVMWSVDGRADRLDRVPAAVVNLDEPVTIGSGSSKQTVPAGRQLAAGLVAPSGSDSMNLDWTLTTASDARDGLADGTYNAVLTIPKDFSKRIVSTQGSDAEQGRLRLQTDEARSAGAALLAQQVTSAATTIFNRQVTTSFLDRTFEGITTLDQQLAKAADGGRSLASGSGKVTSGLGRSHTGAGELSSGLGQLADGTGTLASGAATASTGAASLASGASGVDDGAQQLSSGAGKLADGTSRLAAGAGRLADGTHQARAGARELADGTGAYAKGVKQASTGVDRLLTGLDDESEKTPGLSQGLGSAQTTASTLQAGLEQAAQLLASPDPAAQAQGRELLGQFTAGVGGLATGLGTMKAAVDQQLVPGVKALQQGFTSTDPDHPGLIAGAESLHSGASALARGAKTLDSGTRTLSTSISRLDTGAQSLATGSSQLASGTSQLSTGATQLSGGVSQLSSGAGRLADAAGQASSGSQGLVSGLARLTSGSGQVTSGAKTLARGLDTATDQLPSYTTAQRKALVTVVTTPAVAHTDRLNRLATTSTGIMPNVVPLGLFLGAIATFLLLPALSRRAIASSASAARVAISGWWPACAVGLVQGVLAAIAVPVYDVHVAHPLVAGLVVALAAATFAAVVQALVALFGRVGWVLALLFLILQGVSLGGVIPLVTAPGAIQTLSGLLPVPLATDALTRAAVAGASGPFTIRVLGLALWLLGALATSTLLVVRRRRRGLAVLRPAAA